MAPAPAGRRMGACETHPPPISRPGDLKPSRTTPSSLSSMRRCSSASRSFVLARSAGSGRSSWTPPPPPRPTSHTRRETTHTTHTTGQENAGRTHAPLDGRDPHGCGKNRTRTVASPCVHTRRWGRGQSGWRVATRGGRSTSRAVRMRLDVGGGGRLPAKRPAEPARTTSWRRDMSVLIRAHSVAASFDAGSMARLASGRRGLASGYPPKPWRHDL